MDLHELTSDPGSRRKAKRRGIGIGSGNGKTAGKGHKGQKARAGRSVSPYFEGGQMPLSRRIPKRGFSNFRFADRYLTINVEDIDKHFESGAVVDADQLHGKKLLKGKTFHLKVLGQGSVSKSFTVRAHAFSSSAKSKIESAGGRAEVIKRD